MSRIPSLFATQKPKLIPFLTAGYPKKEDTVDLVVEMADAGADMIEIGMPYSDPLADGPVIQAASEVALKQGVNLYWIFEQVQLIREQTDVPLVLMGYINPLLKFGLKDFMGRCQKSGVDGLIIPDLPLEEAEEFLKLAKEHKVSPILLIAPNCAPERIKVLSEAAGDLLYCTSILGVTGSSMGDQKAHLKEYLGRVRENATTPFVVGFGIRTAEDVEQVNQMADGAVVGSALLNALKEAENPVSKAREFIEELKG